MIPKNCWMDKVCL